jgi:two-component system nitrate/nitrite response regulator NarL
VSAAVPRLRVLVADDHPLYRKAVVDAVRSRAHLEFAGDAADGREALDAIRAQQPDVAVVDADMPGLDGFAVLNAVTRDGLPTRVLLLTADPDARRAQAAIGAGAAGCLFKDTDEDGLCDAIVAVGRGEIVLAPGVASARGYEPATPNGHDRPALSAREREVLALIAEGKSAPEIAARLVLSTATVRTHLQHLYGKLGVSERAAAVAEAMRRGVLE